MSSRLARRYRLLLSVYPDAYLDTHEDEILGTLLDAAEPGQIHPSLREAIGLVAGGLRTRARLAAEAGRAGVWADGLRMAALLLLSSLLSDTIYLGGYLPLTPVLLAVAVVAVVAGATRIGLAAAVPAVLGSWMLYPWTLYNQSPWMAMLQAPWNWVLHGDHGQRSSYGVLAALVVIGTLSWCSLRGGQRRPWPWWLAGLAIAIPALYAGSLPAWAWGHHYFPLSTLELVLPVMLLAAISLVRNDPRPGIAAAVYVLAHLAANISMVVEPAAMGADPIPTLVPLRPILVLLLGLAATAVVTSIVSGRRLAHVHR